MAPLTFHSTDVNFIASQAIARSQQAQFDAANDETSDEKADAMAALERQARAPVGFVAATSGPEGSNRLKEAAAQEPAPANPDAIDVDDDL